MCNWWWCIVCDKIRLLNVSTILFVPETKILNLIVIIPCLLFVHSFIYVFHQLISNAITTITFIWPTLSIKIHSTPRVHKPVCYKTHTDTFTKTRLLVTSTIWLFRVSFRLPEGVHPLDVGQSSFGLILFFRLEGNWLSLESNGQKYDLVVIKETWSRLCDLERPRPYIVGNLTIRKSRHESREN